MSDSSSKPKPKTEKTESKPAKSETKTEPKKTSENKPKKPAAKATGNTPIKNGKGSAPRNMGPEFLSNFDNIRWDSTDEPKPKPGKKFIKKY
ncbi:MAG: hypothetical protein AAF984_06845 [Verrucomicrobiota bacterium]